MNNFKQSFRVLIVLLILSACTKDGGFIKSPEACFEFTINGGNVDFNSSCGQNAESWDWEFGDGATSIAQNPAHVYASHGSFDVSLRISNSKGKTATTTRNVEIEKYCKKCNCMAIGFPGQTSEFCGTKQQADAYCTSCNQQSNSTIDCSCH